MVKNELVSIEVEQVRVSCDFPECQESYLTAPVPMDNFLERAPGWAKYVIRAETPTSLPKGADVLANGVVLFFCERHYMRVRPRLVIT